mmetsp:Transcript_28749/g.43870  ORF Transcript_28749/g.43870 Transcript_28749/m.43870 type:complete len:610 (+) Transcript_28749:60-1889(+)
MKKSSSKTEGSDASSQEPLTIDQNTPQEEMKEEPQEESDEFLQDRQDDDRLILLDSKLKWRLHSSDLPSDFWLRPYFLGCGLLLILFSFWLLDSLKEAILSELTASDGDLSQHLPTAKLCSVITTIILVFFLEFVTNARRQKKVEEECAEKDIDVINGGGSWEKMNIRETPVHVESSEEDDPVPASMFLYLGVPYTLIFMLIAYILEYHRQVLPPDDAGSSTATSLWNGFAYFVFAMIETFGSLTVATFWSYTNSTLALAEAEQYYGLIIAIGQLGAIGGSTMVASRGKIPTTNLLVVASLVIILEIIVMTRYDRRFPATNSYNPTQRQDRSTDELSNMFLSGAQLIMKHNYLLLILGVSCLYEVTLTTLDYQMKLLGRSRFDGTDDLESEELSFSQFLGRFGQLTNVASLLISSVIFPLLMKRLGLRITLRIFPTFLFIVTLVAYKAIPANLSVLVISMSLMKAMTYSLHDPSKELLYIPTSNRIKFRSKFWIDVVGERVAKAIGSGINNAAGSVDRSILIGSVPSILSAIGLWAVCWRVGILFDSLITTGKIVGSDQYAGENYEQVKIITDDDDEYSDDMKNYDKPDPFVDENDQQKQDKEIELITI